MTPDTGPNPVTKRMGKLITDLMFFVCSEKFRALS